MCAKIYCPNCCSEVKLPESSSVGIGMTISKESRGNYTLPLEVVRNNNVTGNNNNVEKKENNTMINDNMNRMNTGMNGFDIEELAKMVAAQLSANAKQNAQEQRYSAPVNVSTPIKATSPVKADVGNLENSTEVDRNHWSENSAFYGKEICGYAYNPYMIRRFLPAQFEQLMRKYNYNVHKGITKEYPYMYSIKYTLEEVRKLAMLEKRDKIAFEERKYVFQIYQCRNIFVKYLDDVIEKLWNDADEFVRCNKVGKEYWTGIKGYGWVNCGKVGETIVRHKVVKTLETSDKFKEILKYLNDLKEKIDNRYHSSYADLYKWMNERPLINVPAETKKSRDFMDCFIRAGAYYTLKQKLMFYPSVTLKGYSGRGGVELLRKYLVKHTDGYVIYAMLKEVIGVR